jgi:pilus assembly protein Flp/PilA
MFIFQFGEVPMKHLSREEGQGLVEYALILVLVAILVIAILLLLGPVIGNVFSNVTAVLLNPGSGSGGGGGSASTITGVSQGTPFGVFTITVTTSENIFVSLSGSVSHSGQMCTGSCKFEFSSPPSSGTATATAADGSTGSVSW